MARDYIAPNSSFIQSAGFDDQTNILGIRFKNGEAWNYLQVPVTTWEQFKAAASAGAFFHSFIKNNYSSQQVE